jgi:SAM-dependent methyltransferase
MSDPYASIAQADTALQARLAGVLELRAADPQQRAILHDYLSAIPLSARAAALEIGCGTGAVTRVLAQRAGVKEVVGIDPSPIFIDQARALYPTATVALEPFDPLQRAVDTMIANFVHNPWLPRRLGSIMTSMGFAVTSVRSHGYTQTSDADYMLTIIDRGADLLAQTGSVGADQSQALKSEARRRVAAGAFFGHISYPSVLARKHHSFDHRRV